MVSTSDRVCSHPSLVMTSLVSSSNLVRWYTSFTKFCTVTSNSTSSMPQLSLKGTHVITQGWFFCCNTARAHSSAKTARLFSVFLYMEGISAHTR